MQSLALPLAFLAFLSLLGVLGPAFVHDGRGVFIMLAGLVLFALFSGLAALLYFGFDEAQA
jgi:hypothetical protein